MPLLVSLGVQVPFLVAYGVPETAALPAGTWWLTQLSPVALAPGHRIGALVLLGCAVALVVLLRRADAWGRSPALLAAVLGTFAALGVALQLILTGTAQASVLGMLLLAVWVVCAFLGVAAGPPTVRDRTPRTGLPWLLTWVLLLPVPLAVGRVLLAPDLRDVAAALQQNTVALRLAALVTASSVRLYLFGMLLGVLAYLGYQCWPGQRRGLRWYVALGLAVLCSIGLWWSGQSVAERRVTQLSYGSPAAELHFTCATWVFPPEKASPALSPTVTLAISGSGCHSVTTFTGYRQLGTDTVPVGLSPVSLRDPRADGSVAWSPPRAPSAGARYGDVLVLAGSSRWDRVADAVVAVRLSDGSELWRFQCADQREVKARFAGGQVGATPAEYRTVAGDPDEVVKLTCGTQRLRFDPRTGLTA